MNNTSIALLGCLILWCSILGRLSTSESALVASLGGCPVLAPTPTSSSKRRWNWRLSPDDHEGNYEKDSLQKMEIMRISPALNLPSSQVSQICPF
jgi:hypothetical protein